MPLNTFVDGTTAEAAEVNSNFSICLLTDTAKTVTVTHTWSASQTLNGGFTGGSSADITVNTNKFTVAASTGNTAVGGTLAVTGASTLAAVSAAAVTASGLITGSAGITVASGQTLTLTGATVAGQPAWSSAQAITTTTAAQPNITSLGTLTALSVSGAATLSSTLSVTGLTECAAMGRFKGDSGGSGLAAEIGITAAGTVPFVQSFNRTAGTFGQLSLRGNEIDLTTDSARRMTVASTGQVLIGTTTVGSTAAGGIRVAAASYFDSTVAVTGAITATGGVVGNAATATALQTARTIGGVSFDGTANITVSTATGGFTVSGGNLALGTNSLTLTGSIASTGSRVAKGWFTDLEVTNAIAGSVTGSSASTTGNAATATALQTARTINGTSFDGTANITVTAAAGTLTGTVLNSSVVTSSLTALGTVTTGVWNAGAVTSSGTVQGTKFKGGSSAPTVATTLAANQIGTGATLTATGTDTAGYVTLTTGTGISVAISAGGINPPVWTLTFNSAYAAVPYATLSPNSNTASLFGAATANPLCPAPTTTALSGYNTIAGTLADSTTYLWFYHVIA